MFPPTATNAELITHILQRRLSVLGISATISAPFINLPPPDVLFHVAAPPGDPPSSSAEAEAPDSFVRLLAHSSVLRQGSDYFREILQQEKEEEDDDFAPPSVSGFSADSPCAAAAAAAENSNNAWDASSVNMPSTDSSSEKDYVIAHAASSSSMSKNLITVSSSDVASFSSSVPAPNSSSCSLRSGEPITDMAALDLPPPSPNANQTTTETDSSCWSSSSSSSSAPPSTRITEGSASSSSAPSFHRDGGHGSAPFRAPRRSILLIPNTSSRDRKSLSGGRRDSISSSSRKSVRFSVAPVDIIPATKSDDDGTKTTMADQSAKQVGDELELLHGQQPSSKDEELGASSSKPEEDEETKMSRIDYVEKPLIKRRQTEVNIVVLMEKTKKEQKKKNDGDVVAPHFYVVKKHDWTAPVLIGILEWLYLGMAHINVVDIAALYSAAYRAALSSLTWCIRRHPIAHYFNLALTNYPTYLQPLLDLCLLADCRELRSLHCFCEALKAVNGSPKVAILETKLVAGRDKDFVRQGFMVLDGHPICVLQASKKREGHDEEEDEDGGEIPDEQLGGGCEQPASFLTFTKAAAQHSVSSNPSYQKMFRKMGNKSNKEQVWRVIVLDNDEAGSLHAFFNYVTKCNHMSMENRGGASLGVKKRRQQERFKFQMITRFKLGTLLVKALRKGIREGLEIREERGCGAYIKGPSYCTSLVLEGLEPNKVLMAAKAIPYEMMGRCALEIIAPNLRTFSNLFHANHTFGLDLQHHTIVLVKPLYVIIKILEYMTKLNIDAYEDPSIQRTFVELIEPTLHV